MRDIIKTYLKLPYKSIDLDVINYVIEDILNNDNSCYTDEEINTIMKAFCYKKASKYYTDFNIEIVNQEYIDGLSKLCNVEGLLLDKTIYLEKDSVLAIKNKDIEILRIIMHEVHHVKQRHMLEYNEVCYKALLLIIEQIIIMEMNDKYYKDNYKYFFEEIDARLEAEFELYDYLSIHSDATLNKELSDICDNVSECEEDTENLLRVVNDKTYDREELFDRIISRKPEYIDYYPLLNFYYNPDGSKISIGSIIARSNYEFKNKKDKKIAEKVKRMDYHVIQNRRGSRYNIHNDIKSLLAYKYENMLSEEDYNSLVNYLTDCIESSDSNYIMDIYDSLISKIGIFKSKINSTVDATNKVATKIYIMMHNLGIQDDDK